MNVYLRDKEGRLHLVWLDNSVLNTPISGGAGDSVIVQLQQGQYHVIDGYIMIRALSIGFAELEYWKYCNWSWGFSRKPFV